MSLVTTQFTSVPHSDRFNVSSHQERQTAPDYTQNQRRDTIDPNHSSATDDWSSVRLPGLCDVFLFDRFIYFLNHKSDDRNISSNYDGAMPHWSFLRLRHAGCFWSEHSSVVLSIHLFSSALSECACGSGRIMEVRQVFVSPATLFLLLLRDSELLPDQAGYSSIVVVHYGQLCCITGCFLT